MALQAVLFDLDGVLIDSEPLGLRIAKQVLDEHGIAITATQLDSFIGVPDKDFYRHIVASHRGYDAETLLKRHTALYESCLDTVELIPGAIELVTRIQSISRIGLVSGSTRPQINQVLERFELSSFFEVIVSADDVPIGKPNPDCFRLAAQRLGVQAVGCIAIEDSESGLKAAKKAQMWTIAYRPNASDRISEFADITVSQLNDISAPVLQDLIKNAWHGGVKPHLNIDQWCDMARALGSFLRRSDYLRPADPFDPWSLLRIADANLSHRLFSKGSAISEDEVKAELGRDLTEGLLRLGVLGRSDLGIVSRFYIGGIFGQLLAIDRPVSKREGQWHSSHTYLDESTVGYLTAIRKFVKRPNAQSALEIGPGSGIACVLMALGGVKRVLGLEIDPSSVFLSRFNAVMNDVDASVQIEPSDMFEYLNNSNERFSTIIFHPPYRIVPTDINYPNATQRIGISVDGLELIRKFISCTRRFLTDRGQAVLAIQLPCYDCDDKLEALRILAQQNNLTLHAVSGGDEISSKLVAQGIALKEEPTRAAEVKSRVIDYYYSLGIIHFKPLLLVLSNEVTV